MALPKVSINVTGSINRPSTNIDGITGFCFYNANIADLTTFSTTNRIIKFTNLAAIEACGITAASTNFKNEHYQLSEFFRMGGVNVWIGVFAVPSPTYDFTELDSMRLYSNGEIKMYVTYTPKALNATDLATFNTKLSTFDAFKKPAIGIFGADTSSITKALLPDLRVLATDLRYTSVVIGQDTLNEALTVTTALNKSVPALGTITGALYTSKVSENILNVGKYNYSNGSILSTPGFYWKEGLVTGSMVPITTIPETDLDSLNDDGYIFFRYLPNYAGTYLSNDHNCAKVTDTFNSIHIMRVRNKVIRELDRSLSPLIGSSVLFNSDGTMRPASISVFEDAAKSVLSTMQSNLEISAFSVFLDQTLNVLSSKTVTINVRIIVVESADNITINLNFTQSL